MEINVKFENLEEMKEFAAQILGEKLKITPDVGASIKENETDNKTVDKTAKNKNSKDKNTKNKNTKDKTKLQEEPDEIEESEEESKKEYTLVEVRKILAASMKAGNGDEVQKILKKYGAKKLSELDKDRYSEVIAEVEAL